MTGLVYHRYGGRRCRDGLMAILGTRMCLMKKGRIGQVPVSEGLLSPHPSAYNRLLHMDYEIIRVLTVKSSLLDSIPHETCQQRRLGPP